MSKKTEKTASLEDLSEAVMLINDKGDLLTVEEMKRLLSVAFCTPCEKWYVAERFVPEIDIENMFSVQLEELYEQGCDDTEVETIEAALRPYHPAVKAMVEKVIRDLRYQYWKQSDTRAVWQDGREAE